MRPIIFHHNDLDGRCAAAVVGKFLKTDPEFVETDYGHPFPMERATGRDVWLVDFSLKSAQFLDLLGRAARVWWIDHHKTAVEAVADLAEERRVSGVWARDGEKSAALLAWEYLFEDPAPWAVEMVSDYDTWKHGDPQTVLFVAGMKAFEDSPGHPDSPWPFLLGAGGEQKAIEIIIDGGAIRTAETRVSAALLRAYGFEAELQGLRLLCLVRPGIKSYAFESAPPGRYDAFCAIAFDGFDYTVSLYGCRPDVDVSAVARSFGGGGHKGAAGFTCVEWPFWGPNLVRVREAWKDG